MVVLLRRIIYIFSLHIHFEPMCRWQKWEHRYICLGKCFKILLRKVQLDKAHLKVFG